jgi:phosphoglucomutase
VVSHQQINLLAGQPTPLSILANIPRRVTACCTEPPDPAVPAQRVAFGASGHRKAAPQAGGRDL